MIILNVVSEQDGGPDIDRIRRGLEDARRARLQREIAALEHALAIAAQGDLAARTRKVFKLRSKIRRKRAELRQPMLLPIGR